MRCKRSEYINAWKEIYARDKNEINSDPSFDEVNPMLNINPLGTEFDNYCVVGYIKDPNGRMNPVGVFSFVCTARKGIKPDDLSLSRVIGKQFAVSPKAQGMGIGKAMLATNMKVLKDLGFTKFYIGCSHMSAGILRRHYGFEPFKADPEHDMFKFNVDLSDPIIDQLYKVFVSDKGIEVA